MPQITPETPRTSFTIGGLTFKIAEPYAEGHTLTAGEADALNQTFRENVRNNLASDIAEAVEASKKEGAPALDHAKLQADVEAYSSGYEFGQRGPGGGRVTDPVEAAAMDIARELVKQAIRSKGLKLSDYKAATISELARGAIAANPGITEQARVRVEAEQKAATQLLASINLGGPANGAPAAG